MAPLKRHDGRGLKVSLLAYHVFSDMAPLKHRHRDRDGDGGHLTMSEEILNLTITPEPIASGVPAQVFPLPAGRRRRR